MKHIQVKTVVNIETFIEEMEVNVYYDLPDDWRYKWVKIDKGTGYYDKVTYYCWAMEHNYHVAGRVGYYYPYAGSNKVKHFKTEAGAKRSLLKILEPYFKSLKELPQEE